MGWLGKDKALLARRFALEAASSITGSARCCDGCPRHRNRVVKRPPQSGAALSLPDFKE
jgi:hypothetical protein